MKNVFLAVVISLFAILWGAEVAGAQYPRISVHPARGRIGETFSVIGRGFQSFERVTVQFGGKWRSLTVDYSGNIKTSFVIPPIDPGIYSVDAYFANSVVISSVFEILPPGILAPTLFMAGDKITIQVWGAVPFSEARVYLNDNEITPSPRPMVGPAGNVAIETVVPSLAHKYYFLSVFKGTRFEAGQVVNLIPDPPGKVENVLAPVAKNIERVWGYDNRVWQLYDPAILPELNTLKWFIEGNGYFVKVKRGCELAAVGGRVYKLYAGWNLIGW